jgi:glycosyltransferase involved in cell wall biosynthesis
MALVSVITPCFNAASYIRSAIDSVLSQTYTNIELLLINDGSTDETEAIILSYADPRIRYFSQNNKGQCAASNYGLSHAKGEYLKFFDADDVMNAMHIEAQLNKLNGQKDALASCAWGRFYDHNYKSAKFIPEPVWKDLPAMEWIKQSLTQKYDMMGAWLWLIPRGVIAKTGGWDERLSLNNDFEFSMRLLTHVTEIKFAEEAKLYYRSGITSLSQQPSLKAFEAAVLSTDLGCSYLLSKEDTSYTRQLCADRYKEWLFRIYPAHKELAALLETKIQELGGSNRTMEGGIVFRFLSVLFGWKKAKLLKGLLRKYGYRKLPFK